MRATREATSAAASPAWRCRFATCLRPLLLSALASWPRRFVSVARAASSCLPSLRSSLAAFPATGPDACCAAATRSPTAPMTSAGTLETLALRDRFVDFAMVRLPYPGTRARCGGGSTKPYHLEINAEDVSRVVGGDMNDLFRRIAHKVTLAVGSWQFFLVSLLVILLWAGSGPFFAFSDTWQLVVNTSTTILTYLLGILILLEANRQARESKIVHGELIESIRGASNALVNIDKMSEEQIDSIEQQLRARARRDTDDQSG